MTKLYDAKPFIIAEIGSNWQTLAHCRNSISLAKACGADAVKFQLFDERSLYGSGFSYTDDGVDAKPPFLPPIWLPILKEKADKEGIEFMCTAFSPELLAAVDPFVEIHKIASSDLAYPQLLEAVAATGKPVLLSTGASHPRDIRSATAYFERDKKDGSNGVILMYCVSAYPARSIDLRVIDELDTLANETGCYGVGFSDHSTDFVGHPVAASSNPGVIVIEKHFTGFPELDTPDGPHSLNSDEFKIMVETIRGIRVPAVGPTREEKSMSLRSNRRLIAMTDIAFGEVLTFGKNYGAFRTRADDSRGLNPFCWKSLEGKPALAEIKQGLGICHGMFKGEP